MKKAWFRLIKHVVADFIIAAVMSVASTSVLAASSAGSGESASSLLSMLPLFLIIIGFFYFMVIRPQSKRAKEQQELMDKLALNDEVITMGGVIGKIAKLRDEFIVIEISEGVNLNLQKTAISKVLPKGTIASIK